MPARSNRWLCLIACATVCIIVLAAVVLQVLPGAAAADSTRPGQPNSAAKDAPATPSRDSAEPVARDVIERFTALEQRIKSLEARIKDLESRLAQAAAADTGPNVAGNPETPAKGPSFDLGKFDPKEVLAKLPGGVIRDAVIEQIANVELKGRFGKLLVTFPKDAKCNDEVILYEAGELDKYIGYANGGYDKELLVGKYAIVVHKTRIEDITVTAKKDTRVPLGAVRIVVGEGTAWEIYPVGGKAYLTYGNGPKDVGLIPGKYEIEVQKKRETITVKAGALTEF